MGQSLAAPHSSFQGRVSRLQLSRATRSPTQVYRCVSLALGFTAKEMTSGKLTRTLLRPVVAPHSDDRGHALADGWNGAGVDPAAYRLPGEAGNTTQYSHRHNKKERRPKNTNLSHHFCVRQRVQAGSPTSASWVSSSTGGARMARAHLNILRLFHFPDTMPVTTTQYNYCQQCLELTAALVVSTTSESPPCSWCWCLASC